MKRHTFVDNQRMEKQECQIAADFVSVDLNSIATTDSRSLGPELVGHSFGEKLEFDRIWVSCGLDEKKLFLTQAVVLGGYFPPAAILELFPGYKTVAHCRK